MGTIKVLVTGAGSGVGQGIIKALRQSRLPVHVAASDITPMHAGLFRADSAMVLPPVEAEGALETIIGRLSGSGVQAVMIGSEYDLPFFARHREEIERVCGLAVVASPPETVEIAGDKWLTARFLEQAGLPHPATVLPADLDEALRAARDMGYPVVVKPRTGTSSRHVHVARDEADLVACFGSVPGAVVQELIARPRADLGAEYTCSVYKTRDGELIGPFTARRTLRGGTSWLVEVRAFERFHPLLTAIGSRLDGIGSLNVQLMEGPRGPVPFEFNARFSGTTAIRAHYGFNEPEMALLDLVLGQKLHHPTIGEGMVLRYVEEVFLDGARPDTLEQHFGKGVVRPWF